MHSVQEITNDMLPQPLRFGNRAAEADEINRLDRDPAGSKASTNELQPGANESGFSGFNRDNRSAVVPHSHQVLTSDDGSTSSTKNSTSPLSVEALHIPSPIDAEP